jgi:hypothetical protein
MQTIHVPVSICNTTLVHQMDDRLPPSLQRLEQQRYSQTIREVNRLMVEGSPRFISLAYIIAMLALCGVLFWATSSGQITGVYIFMGVYFCLTIPFLIYAIFLRNKVCIVGLPSHIADVGQHHPIFGQ